MSDDKVNDKDLDEKDEEFEKAVSLFLSACMDRGYALTCLINVKEGLRFVEHWPRWSAIQMAGMGPGGPKHVVVPKEMREAVDPRKTVNIAGNMCQAAMMTTNDLARAVNGVIQHYKVVVKATNPEQSIILPGHFDKDRKH